jgi:hypothetical protein
MLMEMYKMMLLKYFKESNKRRVRRRIILNKKIIVNKRIILNKRIIVQKLLKI